MSKRKFVYFAISGDGKTVKIGSSVDPVKRIKFVSWETKTPLSLLFKFPGSHRVEYGIHSHFGADHIGHEWFRYSADIQTFISAAMQHGISASMSNRFRRLFASGKWRELNAARYTQSGLSLKARHSGMRHHIYRER